MHWFRRQWKLVVFNQRVSAYLQTCKMTEVKLKSVICTYTFFIYVCLLHFSLPVTYAAAFQASRSYILNIVLF